MNNNQWVFHPGVYIALCIYFILGFMTLMFGNNIATMMYDEDRYFEYIGAISLFIASGIAFYTFYQVWKTRKTNNIFWGKQLVYLGIALLYFFGGGEEISWGQRIFGIKQPESLPIENVQDELNIHNLAVFENSSLLKADNIFSVFWIGFTVLVPLGCILFEKFQRLISKWIPIVHWSIGLLFLLNYFLAQLSEIVFGRYYSFESVPFVQAVQEIKESNYEFMFIFLSIFVMWDFIKPKHA